jgi:hypothetical protein
MWRAKNDASAARGNAAVITVTLALDFSLATLKQHVKTSQITLETTRKAVLDQC